MLKSPLLGAEGSYPILSELKSESESPPLPLETILFSVAFSACFFLFFFFLLALTRQIINDNRLGVKTPILRENYIEMFSDYSLVNSNVLEFGYRTADGFNSELLLFERKKNK